MPVSPTEAQDALRDISATAQASAMSFGYRMASPHFILWGVIWVIAWSASYFDPTQNWVWLVLDAVGIAGSFYLGRRAARHTNAGAQRGRWGLKFGGSVVAIAAFVAAFFAVMPPSNPLQIGAFFPLLVALLYSLAGLWANATRLVLIGIGIALLTLIGFFWLPQLFLLWMAVVGGGALIFAGLWLRTA
jgi:hypothetical protein